ncbi:MAG: CDP-alcohol phosphatidyltransferase family protein [Kiritimatiellae bacterium]|nr:CDP-alcohol phosphatidyltransferase family protein [Kiritimatiellia bacterium]
MTRFAFVTTLTFARAPLVLAGCGFALANLAAPNPGFLAAAVLLMALSALTDLFDGKLARKWRVASRLGALADPLMDKVFYLATLPTATFVALWCEDAVHASILLALDVVSLLRDQWASFLRSVGSEYGADVRASFAGKLRTFVAFPAIVLVHLRLGLQILALHDPAFEGVPLAPDAAVWTLEGFLIALTVWSGAVYTVRFIPFLRRAATRCGG